MKHQHWGLAWCLAALCCASAASAATVLERISAGGKLVIAHRESAVPFSYVDAASGKPVGYAVDLCLRLAEVVRKKAGAKNMDVEFVMVSPSNRIDMIEQGKADLECGSTTNNAERRQKVAFSQVYYMMQNRFVGRSDKAADFADTPEHFKGKVIAVQEGTPQDNFITARYGDVAKIKRYVNAQSPMLDLQSSRADYTFGNMVQLKVGFLDKEMGKQFAFVGPQYNGTQDKILGEGVAVALRKKDDKLKSQFDGVIRSFVPMHSIVRIDEVERLGTAKISEAKGGGNVMPFPMPMPEK